MNAVEKLRSMVGEVAGPASEGRKGEAWALVGRLLSRMPVNRAEAERVCAERDVAGLDALVGALERPAPRAGGDASPQQMEAALRAFKKRLKLARLADESRLGNRYVTGGRESSIDAIIPPREFPDAVWAALAREGKLRDTGQGFYALG